MRDLTRAEARRWRHASQLLAGSDLSPAEVVDRAVGLQGQNLPGVLRAIAMRSRPGTTIDDVKAAFDRGEIVRSWLVRGTLFATTPAHLSTLLALTSERIHRSAAKRRQELGLDDAVLAAAREIGLRMIGAGPGDGPTRAELLEAWNEAGIETDGGRGYHLIFHHGVGGAWHWGAFRGNQQVLAAPPTAPRAAADGELVDIVRRLVAARAPMSGDDIAWWLKLPKTQVRRAAAEAGLTEVAVEGAPAWVVGDEPGDAAPGITLAPSFDEWILGYADRSLTASDRMLSAVLPGKNGVFRPVVLVDGVTVGTWQGRSQANREPSFELVERVPAATKKRIAAALERWPLA